MTRSISPQSPFFGPLAPYWTITRLLEWVASDDAHCHDERLSDVMDAAAQALGAQPAGPAIGVVARVRLVASRVAADAAAGERTLSSVIAEREEVRGGAVPVPMEVSTASASASPTRTPAATSSRAGGGALVGA
ncbi:hypothetical protein M3672_03480 [Microbacterium enclense]|uniref:hypothetical protein n=1 Tax=Microbacterium enclense TaxID=993073 RepID=UPI00203DCA87|nr:hypothetical protein [Microbacterium enclense]MCM3613497.1 hypothetical protein [Microbacterium enclense]